MQVDPCTFPQSGYQYRQLPCDAVYSNQTNIFRRKIMVGENNKVVIVTGGSSGIGRCTASALKENGCIVYEFSRRNIPMEGVTHLDVYKRQIYLTDTVGLNPGIVGTLIAVSKLFDGITDIFFGSMIDLSLIHI